VKSKNIYVTQSWLILFSEMSLKIWLMCHFQKVSNILKLQYDMILYANTSNVLTAHK